jgi:pimeloyl-ACP methyl ester carboxylesterase
MPLTMHKAAASLQLRIIAPDRPGIGSSSQLPQRTVQQYAADMAEICQQLGVQQFSAMASSAGSMYALALTMAPETRDMIVGKVGESGLRLAQPSLGHASSIAGAFLGT